MIKNKKGRVIVITDIEDAHVPYVQPHLHVPLHVLDPQTLISDTTLSYKLQGDEIIATYGDLRLDNIKGVWYRKPRDIRAEQVPVAADYRDYSASALYAHTTLLLTAFEDAVWVSDCYAIWRAGNKSLQLELAKRLGFRVPATLITSDKAAAKRFITGHSQTLIKPLASSSLPIVAGVVQTFFATKVNQKALPDLSNLHLGPAIFQQAIDAAYDVRVNVVGGKVFAAAIHSKESAESSKIRDWRVGQFDDEIHIESYNLPPDITELCRKHVTALGLNFGALDLVMDTKGKLWFIENNPNGQWAFIEKAINQPIGKAMAQLLESKIF